MPDNSAYHGICTLSKALRATTLNFCLGVSGATWPEPSRVRKFGSARKSRSFDVPAFDVPAFFPWVFAPGAALSLFLSLFWSGAALSAEVWSAEVWGEAAGAASCPDGAGFDELSLCGAGCAAPCAGSDAAGSCCAAATARDAKKRKLKNTGIIMNGWVVNFVGKRFSKTTISRLRRDGSYSSSSTRAGRRRNAALHWFTKHGFTKHGFTNDGSQSGTSSRKPSFRRDVARWRLAGGGKTLQATSLRPRAWCWLVTPRSETPTER